jgi:hypothetical protein
MPWNIHLNLLIDHIINFLPSIQDEQNRYNINENWEPIRNILEGTSDHASLPIKEPYLSYINDIRNYKESIIGDKKLEQEYNKLINEADKKIQKWIETNKFIKFPIATPPGSRPGSPQPPSTYYYEQRNPAGGRRRSYSRKTHRRRTTRRRVRRRRATRRRR